MAATLHYDLGSPYAFIAVERAERVLGVAPSLQPVLLGAIFKRRGRGSWAHTESRAFNIEDIEDRAARYGLAPLNWPDVWPTDTLAAMRAATWADAIGAGDAFARLAFRRAFLEAGDLGDVAVLSEVARAAGLDPPQMLKAIARPEVKHRLRVATDAAWALGVAGVPTLAVGDRLFYGDDQLDGAGELMRA